MITLLLCDADSGSILLSQSALSNENYEITVLIVIISFLSLSADVMFEINKEKQLSI